MVDQHTKHAPPSRRMAGGIRADRLPVDDGLAAVAVDANGDLSTTMRNASLTGTLGVTGAATLSSTLGVTGVLTATGGVALGAASASAIRVVEVALGTVATAGGVLSWENPAGAAIMAALVVDLTTASSGAATVNFGVAADGTTSSDTLMDGLDVNTAAGVFNGGNDAGTNGGLFRKLASGQFITGSQATGSVSGLAGSAYIAYWLA